LTGDLKHFPDPGDISVQDTVEINAPAFCDPGTGDRSNGSMMCSRDAILRAIALRPLSFEPWTRPLYSNTGFNLLGWATAQAAKKNKSELAARRPKLDEKVTVEKLLHQDVFEPLGMMDSSFWVPLDKRDNVAVPSSGVPSMIDWDFTSTFNPYDLGLSHLRVVLEECIQPRTISQNLSIKYYYLQTRRYCQTNK
jgi:hypothetical protein